MVSRSQNEFLSALRDSGRWRLAMTTHGRFRLTPVSHLARIWHAIRFVASECGPDKAKNLVGLTGFEQVSHC